MGVEDVVLPVADMDGRSDVVLVPIVTPVPIPPSAADAAAAAAAIVVEEQEEEELAAAKAMLASGEPED